MVTSVVPMNRDYHPIFCFNQDGDVEAALLRHGNVASAHDWRSVLLPVIERYRDLDIPKWLRADAAFAIPELYELLEAEGYRYVIRLPANDVLHREIAHDEASGGSATGSADRALSSLRVSGGQLE